MNEITKRKLNPTEAIAQAIPRLIEAFVMFYGEKERENITRKFNNMIVVGHMKPKQITAIIREDLENRSNELIDQLCEKLQIVGNKREIFKESIFGKYDLEYTSLHPINSYLLYLENNKRGKNYVVQFVKAFFPEVTEENIDEFIQSGKLDKLNQVAKEYKQVIEQYNQYKETFKRYYEYVERCQNLENELEVKYMRMMLQEIGHLFSEEELHEIQKELDKPFGKNIKSISKKTECYFGYHINNESLIDAFSDENERILEGEKTWRQESVIKDRINYFKNIGINLGDDYQTYVNNLEIQKLWPKLKELADKIIRMRNEFYNKMMNEYYQTIDEYKQNMARIQNAGLINENFSYNARTYELNQTYVSDNIRKTTYGYENVPILCFSMGGIKEYLDHVLIHELNHVYELSLQRVDEEYYYSLCGWDKLRSERKQQTEEVRIDEVDEKRDYELFSEIINEMIAQEITEMLFDAGGYIFNTKDNAKIKGGTGYEHTWFLASSFYETYKQQIIESRRTGDITKLFESVGRENFEALNDLFREFNDNFAGFAYYNLMDSLIKKEETAQTKKFKEIKAKRDTILLAMEEHSKTKIGQTL